LSKALAGSSLTGADRRWVTELVSGAARHLGSLDAIIEAAAGRSLTSLQPAVVDVLRLGAQQLLYMRVATHAAIDQSVELARHRIGQRVTGLVNAVLRRVAVQGLSDWLDQLSVGLSTDQQLALRTSHPLWIVQAYRQVLPASEVEPALLANNQSPVPTLVVRPGLLERAALLALAGGEPTPYSPWGVIRAGDPGEVAAIQAGLAGVQDEGSQLMAGLLDLVDAPDLPWLDLCAGPGGKTALMTGLAQKRRQSVVGAELHQHRARLVVDALRGYGVAPVVVADGRIPAWNSAFGRVLVDAPCSGLGALRRRPEARWRKQEADLGDLCLLQRALIDQALDSVPPGGVVAYVTCSPHRRETVDQVAAVEASGRAEVLDAPSLWPQVEQATALDDRRCLQLWPHRHGTDAMFAAVLRRQ
jgi:16S rRNA (cytosine967-C5)-methyltransferase